MPYKGADQDQKNLTEYAKGNVHQLRPAPEYTVADDIIQALSTLLADIKSGEIEPSHLIIGWGERVEIDGAPGKAYIWDAVGLETTEVVGHLTTYATKLAMGEGE